MAPIFDLDPKEVTSYPHALIGSVDQLDRGPPRPPRTLVGVLRGGPGRVDGRVRTGRRRPRRHLIDSCTRRSAWEQQRGPSSSLAPSRALSSAGQSAALTRQMSGVRLPQRPPHRRSPPAGLKRGREPGPPALAARATRPAGARRASQRHQGRRPSRAAARAGRRGGTTAHRGSPASAATAPARRGRRGGPSRRGRRAGVGPRRPASARRSGRSRRRPPRAPHGGRRRAGSSRRFSSPPGRPHRAR